MDSGELSQEAARALQQAGDKLARQVLSEAASSSHSRTGAATGQIAAPDISAAVSKLLPKRPSVLAQRGHARRHIRIILRFIAATLAVAALLYLAVKLITSNLDHTASIVLVLVMAGLASVLSSLAPRAWQARRLEQTAKAAGSRPGPARPAPRPAAGGHY